MINWCLYNPNPNHSCVGDCTVRALSKALNQDWDTTYLWMSVYGFVMKNMPSGNCVWGRYLENQGFSRRVVDGYPESRYTVQEFCKDNPTGVYVLGLDGHVVCVEDGQYYDSWDSGEEIIIYYWEKEKHDFL